MHLIILFKSLPTKQIEQGGAPRFLPLHTLPFSFGQLLNSEASARLR
jgi:hypothetical protein